MKNVYETPVVEELLVATADVITASVEGGLTGGADDSGTDNDWGLL